MLENLFIIIGLLSCMMGFLYIAIIMVETLLLRLYDGIFRVLIRDKEYRLDFPAKEK